MKRLTPLVLGLMATVGFAQQQKSYSLECPELDGYSLNPYSTLMQPAKEQKSLLYVNPDELFNRNTSLLTMPQNEGIYVLDTKAFQVQLENKPPVGVIIPLENSTNRVEAYEKCMEIRESYANR